MPAAAPCCVGGLPSLHLSPPIQGDSVCVVSAKRRQPERKREQSEKSQLNSASSSDWRVQTLHACLFKNGKSKNVSRRGQLQTAAQPHSSLFTPALWNYVTPFHERHMDQLALTRLHGRLYVNKKHNIVLLNVKPQTCGLGWRVK